MKITMIVLSLVLNCFAQMLITNDSTIEEPPVYPYQVIDESFYEQEDYVTLNTAMIDTAVVIIKEIQKDITNDEAYNIATLLYQEHLTSEMDFSFFLAIAATETRFKHNSRSWAGARGLMQMLPSTFVYVAKKHGYNYNRWEVTDLKKNIAMSAVYLKMLYSRYDGDLRYVSAGYNGGPGTAERYIKHCQGHYARVPRETMNYVIKVDNYYRTFKKRLGE